MEYNYNHQNKVYAPYRPVKPVKKSHTVLKIISSALLGVVLGAGAVFAIAQNYYNKGIVVTETLVEVNKDEPSSLSEVAPIQITDLSNPVPEIVEVALPSVVSIQSYTRHYVSGQEPIDERLGTGSGFVISEDGLILTNHHVIDEGNFFKVITSDGSEYTDIEILGSDPNTEIAVLKVKGLDLPALRLGDSSIARTGEMVIAVGNPIGDSLTGTATVGYLSGTNRVMDLNNSGVEIPMLQTDAAINPGNSGGPLFNMSGEVIGITTMKVVYAGVGEYGSAISAEGIGYAIPINTAKEVVDYIIENGEVPIPEKLGIGFTYQLVTAQDAQLWGVPQGAMVIAIAEGSPAQQAGLKPYDVITSLDGVSLVSGQDLPTFENHSLGDIVTAEVWRNGQMFKLEFTLVDINRLN